MNIFSRIKAFIKQEPEEQIAGYSIPELKSVFVKSLLTRDGFLPSYPRVTPLEGVGIPAYYTSFIIDQKETLNFVARIESKFNYVTEKTFNDLIVKKYSNTQKNEHLIFFTSTREFNSVTVRLVTNSADFLAAIADEKFSVPPPWVAFESYNPSWWGGHMQGAQGYYNDNYFLPFFTQLSDSEKQSYYAKFEAPTEWIKALELIHDDE
ncbi:hypothetical protein KJF94_08960 [Pseudomonas hormoni]|uniref:Uncharacterized protein n=1 Tax=Pseudomonas hormoni TaxID=3093767 RepID=A0ABX8F443_9PSED|nr:hypothetical protein [Pseudomonas hormoni]QVW25657.1 hypothetical protein KJF94_08960 [Pseudomonas hormoni]